MLFNLLKRMILRGQTNSLREKIDMFYALDRLTKDEYDALIGMLPVEQTEQG